MTVEIGEQTMETINTILLVITVIALIVEWYISGRGDGEL